MPMRLVMCHVSCIFYIERRMNKFNNISFEYKFCSEMLFYFNKRVNYIANAIKINQRHFDDNS